MPPTGSDAFFSFGSDFPEVADSIMSTARTMRGELEGILGSGSALGENLFKGLVTSAITASNESVSTIRSAKEQIVEALRTGGQLPAGGLLGALNPAKAGEELTRGLLGPLEKLPITIQQRVIPQVEAALRRVSQLQSEIVRGSVIGAAGDITMAAGVAGRGGEVRAALGTPFGVPTRQGGEFAAGGAAADLFNTAARTEITKFRAGMDDVVTQARGLAQAIRDNKGRLDASLKDQWSALLKSGYAFPAKSGGLGFVDPETGQPTIYSSGKVGAPRKDQSTAADEMAASEQKAAAAYESLVASVEGLIDPAAILATAQERAARAEEALTASAEELAAATRGAAVRMRAGGGAGGGGGGSPFGPHTPQGPQDAFFGALFGQGWHAMQGFNPNMAVANLAGTAGVLLRYGGEARVLFGAIGQVKEAFAGFTAYEDQMVNLREALEATNTSQVNLNAAIDAGAQSGVNSAQSIAIGANAIQAYSQDIAAGASATDIFTESVKQAGIASVLTGVDAAKASQQLIAATKGFNLGAGGQARIQDAYTNAVKNFGGDRAQVLDAVSQAAGDAQLQGISPEELANIAALIQRNNPTQTGSAVASELQKLIIRGENPQFTSALTNAGVAQTGDFVTEIEQLSTAYGRMDQKQKEAFVTALGGARAIGDLLPLLKDGKELVDANAKSAEGGGNAASLYYQKISTISGQLRQFATDLKNLSTEIGRSGIFLPIGAGIELLKPAIETLNSILRIVNNLPGHFGQWAVAITEVVLAYKLLNSEAVRTIFGRGTAAVANRTGRGTAAAEAGAAAGGAGAENEVTAAKNAETAATARLATAEQEEAAVRTAAAAKMAAQRVEIWATIAAEKEHQAALLQVAEAQRLNGEAAAAGTTEGLSAEERLTAATLEQTAATEAAARAQTAYDTAVAAGAAGAEAAAAAALEMALALERQAAAATAAAAAEADLAAAELAASAGTMPIGGGPMRTILPAERTAAARGPLFPTFLRTGGGAAAGEAAGAARVGVNLLPAEAAAAEGGFFASLLGRGAAAGRGLASGVASGASSALGGLGRFASRGVGLNFATGAVALGGIMFDRALYHSVSGMDAASSTSDSARLKASTAQTVQDLQASADNLGQAAQGLKHSSSGFFGATLNWLMGDPTGHQATQDRQIQTAQVHAMKDLQAAISAASSSAGGIDFSSAKGLANSLQTLQGQGRDARDITDGIIGGLNAQANAAAGGPAYILPGQTGVAGTQLATRFGTQNLLAAAQNFHQQALDQSTSSRIADFYHGHLGLEGHTTTADILATGTDVLSRILKANPVTGALDSAGHFVSNIVHGRNPFSHGFFHNPLNDLFGNDNSTTQGSNQAQQSRALTKVAASSEFQKWQKGLGSALSDELNQSGFAQGGSVDSAELAKLTKIAQDKLRNADWFKKLPKDVQTALLKGAADVASQAAGSVDFNNTAALTPDTVDAAIAAGLQNIPNAGQQAGAAAALAGTGNAALTSDQYQIAHLEALKEAGIKNHASAAHLQQLDDALTSAKLQLQQDTDAQIQAMADLATSLVSPFDKSGQLAAQMAGLQQKLANDTDPVTKMQDQTAVNNMANQQLMQHIADQNSATAAAANPYSTLSQDKSAVTQAQNTLNRIIASGVTSGADYNNAVVALKQAKMQYAQDSLSDAQALLEASTPIGNQAAADFQQAVDLTAQADRLAKKGGDPGKIAGLRRQAAQLQIQGQQWLDQAGLAMGLAALDPRDVLGAAEVQLAGDRQALKDIPKGDYLARAQQQQKIKQDRLAVHKDHVDLANAEAEASVFPGSQLESAHAKLVEARNNLSLDLKGTAQYYQDLAALHQAQIDLANAHIEAADVQRQLTIDITNPVAMARDAVEKAREKMQSDIAHGASHDVVNQDRLDLMGLTNQAERTAFEQRLQDAQTNAELGRTSYAAYVSYLQSEHNRLVAIGHRTRQQQEELNEVDQALKSVASSAGGQFNLGQITVPTVYQARRTLAATNGTGVYDYNPIATGTQFGMGQDPATAAATAVLDPVAQSIHSLSPAATKANNALATLAATLAVFSAIEGGKGSHNTHITINGADMGAVLNALKSSVGTAALSSRTTTQTRKA